MKIKMTKNESCTVGGGTCEIIRVSSPQKLTEEMIDQFCRLGGDNYSVIPVNSAEEYFDLAGEQPPEGAVWPAYFVVKCGVGYYCPADEIAEFLCGDVGDWNLSIEKQIPELTQEKALYLEKKYNVFIDLDSLQLNRRGHNETFGWEPIPEEWLEEEMKV